MTVSLTDEILAQAKRCRKGDWRAYNELKSLLAALRLDGETYEKAIKAIADILEL